jgi:hypothetical protein
MEYSQKDDNTEPNTVEVSFKMDRETMSRVIETIKPKLNLQEVFSPPGDDPQSGKILPCLFSSYLFNFTMIFLHFIHLDIHQMLF